MGQRKRYCILDLEIWEENYYAKIYVIWSKSTVITIISWSTVLLEKLSLSTSEDVPCLLWNTQI
jgi:hypothetical protein